MVVKEEEPEDLSLRTREVRDQIINTDNIPIPITTIPKLDIINNNKCFSQVGTQTDRAIDSVLEGFSPHQVKPFHIEPSSNIAIAIPAMVNLR